MLDYSFSEWNNLEGINQQIIPFLACGDLNYPDSDTNYPLQVNKLLENIPKLKIKIVIFSVYFKLHFYV